MATNVCLRRSRTNGEVEQDLMMELDYRNLHENVEMCVCVYVCVCINVCLCVYLHTVIYLIYSLSSIVLIKKTNKKKQQLIPRVSTKFMTG